jgi:hypothetical protein
MMKKVAMTMSNKRSTVMNKDLIERLGRAANVCSNYGAQDEALACKEAVELFQAAPKVPGADTGVPGTSADASGQPPAG